ncbi:hypothetical protein BBK91_027240, partial [Agrobacterium vitis]|nr:hypothetical protein [Agrobacterium vitis]MUO45793.1 hypothetical protein [Agrobacterium vitis]MUP13485.1 hypothetical protein [Agrobacterium vitis]
TQENFYPRRSERQSPLACRPSIKLPLLQQKQNKMMPTLVPRYSVIRGLVAEGVSIKEIARRTGHSRKLVRSVVRGQRTDIFRVRQTSLEPQLPWLEAQWDAGLRNGAELWRQLRLVGFGGGLRVVTEWATRRRRAEKAENGLGHAPAARTVVRLMTLERNNLTKAQTMTVAAIEERLPDLVEARDVVESFHEMLRRKSKDDLDTWIDRAATSLVASFANGVIRDRAAVQNAITSIWLNGQTEGQINKLKLIKRQMYGRGKLDLLEARIVGAYPSEQNRGILLAARDNVGPWRLMRTRSMTRFWHCYG